MSRYLKMRLLIVTITIGMLHTVWSAEQCIRAKQCNDHFVVKAKAAATDEETYCWAVREKIDCLENVKGQCTPDQQRWVQDDIRTTKDENSRCGSVSPASMSLTAMFGLAFVILMFNKQ